MRLIDADALIEKYQRESGVDLYRYNVIEDLVESPTVDAVPVVRCKDCKYWRESRFEKGVHICYWGSFTRQGDEFCSWGEKNDGENV